MTVFKLGNGMEIVCESKSTRNGFKHEATLISENGYACEKAKICYINRTWESFQYESVLNKICDKVFKKMYRELRKETNKNDY